VRRVLIVLAALMMAGAVGYAAQANGHHTSCPTTLDFNGVSYTVHHLRDEVGQDDLGVGTERGCGDKGRWSEAVAVSRIAGVDSRTALVTPVAVDVLYLAEGVSVDELPSDIADLVVP
jgi:hypothetical protein